MKNGKFIAIFIGFVIGLLLTLGIYSAQRAYNSVVAPSPTPTSVTQTLEDVTAPAEEFSLFQPTDYSITTSRAVEFSGTAPGAFVVVGMTNETEVFATPNASGDFVIELDLEPGLNLVTFVAIEEGSNQQTKLERTIYYQAAPTQSAGDEE